LAALILRISPTRAITQLRRADTRLLLQLHEFLFDVDQSIQVSPRIIDRPGNTTYE